jgi:hypothetical protein
MGRNFMMQQDRDEELADRLERLIELDPAAVYAEAFGFQRLCDIGRCD